MWVEKPYRCSLTFNTHCSKKKKTLIVVIQRVQQSITLTKVSFVIKINKIVCKKGVFGNTT